jgi:magnesium-transporting ATPase (P-type)
VCSSDLGKLKIITKGADVAILSRLQQQQQQQRNSSNVDKDNNDIVIHRNYSKELIDDIVYVARSLGFISHYYANKFIHINGDLSFICSKKRKYNCN